MLPPGVYAGSLLPCCPRSSEGNHPWDRSLPRCQGLPVWSLTGQVARSGFVVTEGNLRGTDGVPRQLQAAPAPGLRVLLTTVRCLSNWSRKRPAACCTAAFLTLVLPCCPFPLTADRWLPGRPGHGGGAERQSSPPQTHRAGCLWVKGCRAAWHLALVVKEWPPCSRCFCSGSQFSLSHVANADKAGWQSSGRLLPSLFLFLKHWS